MIKFVDQVYKKLERFQACAEDFEADGVDIGRNWLDTLTFLGLLTRVQRSPALWEINEEGELALKSKPKVLAHISETSVSFLDQRKDVENTAWRLNLSTNPCGDEVVALYVLGDSEQ